ncbi:MAG: S4 domain-containing protein [Syntrophobacterales bacterium]
MTNGGGQGAAAPWPSPQIDTLMTLERLQKFLSRAGVASRRQAESLILEGKVKVNGRVVTELGVKIDPEKDRVQVEGKRVQLPSAPVTFMLHKPSGFVSTTRDPQGRRTVMDLAPQEHGRLYPVPGPALEKLARGIELDGRPVSTEVRLIKSGSGKTILEITVWEGRYHLIKRLLEDVGYPVLKLKRIAFGPLRLGRLARGVCRPLTRQEQVNLQVTVGRKYLRIKTMGKTPSKKPVKQPEPLETRQRRRKRQSRKKIRQRHVQLMPPGHEIVAHFVGRQDGKDGHCERNPPVYLPGVLKKIHPGLKGPGRHGGEHREQKKRDMQKNPGGPWSSQHHRRLAHRRPSLGMVRSYLRHTKSPEK